MQRDEGGRLPTCQSIPGVAPSRLRDTLASPKAAPFISLHQEHSKCDPRDGSGNTRNVQEDPEVFRGSHGSGDLCSESTRGQRWGLWNFLNSRKSHDLHLCSRAISHVQEHTKCGPRDSRDIPGNIPRSAFGVLLDVRDERGRPSDSRRSRRCSASPTTSTFAQQSQIISNVEGIRILGIFLRIAFGVLLDVRDERGRLPTCQRTRRRLPRLPRIAFGVVLVQRDERECEWCPERSYELLSGVIGN